MSTPEHQNQSASEPQNLKQDTDKQKVKQLVERLLHKNPKANSDDPYDMTAIDRFNDDLYGSQAR